MEQRRYTTQSVVPNSGESWNSEQGARADNASPDTVLSPDDPYYDLAMSNIKQVEKHDQTT